MRYYLHNWIKYILVKTEIIKIINIWREIKRIWVQKDIIANDIKITKQELAKTKCSDSPPNNKTILIINLSTLISQAKTDSLLSRYLMERGTQICVITYKKHIINEKYYKLFGINHIIYLEDYFQYNKIKRYYAEARELCKNYEYSELKQAKYKGTYELGKQVLTSIGRKSKKGKESWNAIEMRSIVLEKMIEGMQIYDAMEAIIEKHKPAQAIMNEIFYLECSACANALIDHSVPIIQYISDSDRKSIIMKKRTSQENLRDHPMAMSKEIFNKILEQPFSEEQSLKIKEKILEPYISGKEINQNNKKIKTKQEVYEQLGLDKEKKNVVIYSHVLWDANMFYGKDLYEDFEEWFVETIRTACRNPAVNWIVKMHPANVWKNPRGEKCREMELIEENFDSLPPNFFLIKPDTDINTYSFFEITDCAVTVRGTIGMELPCLGIPVLTAGTGRYSGLGFTLDSATKEEYEERLLNVQNYEKLKTEDISKARKYVYAIKKLVPYQFEGVKYSYNTHLGINHPFITQCAIEVNSGDKFWNNSEARRFCDWALEANDLDSVDFSRIRLSNSSQFEKKDLL